jgi:hypothetical protein
MRYEHINNHTTARKCCECQRPARFWRFALDVLGAVNRSSRQPVCDAHVEAE